MTEPRVIMLEFNELCPPLLQRWMAAGKLPNFKHFYEHSQAFVTEADEPEGRTLNPWIQWYSIHTGLPYSEHGVRRLTDGPGAGHTDIWQVLREQGYSVANCSSMNAKGFAAEGSFFLPDPWCTSEAAYPAELAIFHDFVVNGVQEYSNATKASKARDAIRFLRFMAGHGLGSKTVGKIVRQLFDEKIARPSEAWKRAVILDWLQLDLFRYYFRANRPAFSTFFLNSTAHYQHAYWRHMQPEAFEVKPSPAEIAQYGDAVLFGYQNMDRLLAEFMRLERDGVTLILVTGLSQQPFLKFESIGGQLFNRPTNIEGLLRELGVAYDTLQPTMTHQYMLRFAHTQDKQAAAAAIAELQLDGRDVFIVRDHADRSLYISNQIKSKLPEGAELYFKSDPDRRLPYHEHFYTIEQTKAGRHHSDGVLWIKTGSHLAPERKVTILDIFPTVLAMLGAVPPANGGPYVGQSLLPSFGPG